MILTGTEKDVELECSLCKDIYREPKTLGCLHSFCLECLETHYEKTHSNVNLSCPICRTPFQSESRDQLSNLSTDSFLLNSLNIHNSLKNSISHPNHQKLMCLDEENEATHYCLDCQDYFCGICAKAHQKTKATKNHQLIPIEEMKNQAQVNSVSISSSQTYCQIHQQKELELFCNDCKEPICSLCVLQHSSHKFSSISDVIENEKQSLIDLINQVKPKEKELKGGMSKCEDVIKELEINSTTTQIQINEYFNKIRIKLDEKEQELLNKLNEIEKHKKKELELQKEELKFGIESIIGSCQMIENSLSLSNNKKNDARLLSMKKLYCSRLNYLSNNIWKIEPCHHSLIGFSIFEKEDQSLYSNISNIGMINSNEISAEKCLILRNEDQRIYENEEFEFGITSHSKEGKEMKIGGNKMKFGIQIVGEPKNGKNEKNEWDIIDLNNGKYEVKMKMKSEGEYFVFVQFNGIDINSSPFQIQVSPKQRIYTQINLPKLTFGYKGEGGGQFSNPYGVAVNSNGNILVSDTNNHRVQIFDSKGNFISQFGSTGNGNGQFEGPFGVTINSKRNIIVSDLGNHRIQIFDSEGKFLSTFGSNGFVNGRFNYPREVCVDMNDNIYVCDCNNNRIQIFDSQGKFVSTFGFQGNGNGQFNCPYGAAINSKGNIIVSDYSNHRIQIFDLEGKFISTFGSQGNGNGQFNNPLGICVDSSDNILVCDYSSNRIQVFTPNGEYISQFKMDKPTDVAIDPKTQNIVVSGYDNKVSIY